MNANTIVCWSSLLVLLVAAQQNLANANETSAKTMEACEIPVDHFRLPERYLPMNYDLVLRLNPNLETFSGTVSIHLDTNKALSWKKTLAEKTLSGKIHPFATDPKNIIMNADGLIVHGAMFDQLGRQSNPGRICYDAVNKIVVISLRKKPQLGEGLLTLKFIGTVNDEAKGLFKSAVHPEKVMLATHFKLNHARKMFPCFDEPDFKATFQLTIVHPAETIALSNMEGHKVTLADGDLETTFIRTPNMASYLVSVAVGDLECAWSSLQGEAMTIAIYAPKGLSGHGSNMLGLAVQAYAKVSGFFSGVSQPLTKIDIVALDRGPIAMENWGLITMRWDLFASNALDTENYDHIRELTIIMAQMIHQRLSNVVTICWWNDLWIQEGIAAHLASILTAELYPGIGIELHRLVDTTFSAMNEDDKKPRAINDPKLKTAGEFDAAFDLFAYKKSAALMNMFANYFGEEKFIEAVRDFLRLFHKSGLVVGADWWKVFSRGSKLFGHTMEQIASQWSLQIGYPTITVQPNPDGKMLVMQRPDLANNQVWTVLIPYELHAGTKRSTIKQLILSDLEYTLPLIRWFNMDKIDHWLSFNWNDSGYYRVIYLYNPLLEARNRAMIFRRLPSAIRMEILSDCFAIPNQLKKFVDFEKIFLLFSEETEDGVVLLLTRMLGEHDVTRWSSTVKDLAAALMMNYLRNGLDRRPVYNPLNHYTRYQVFDYLVNRVQDPEVTQQVQIILAEQS